MAVLTAIAAGVAGGIATGVTSKILGGGGGGGGGGNPASTLADLKSATSSRNSPVDVTKSPTQAAKTYNPAAGKTGVLADPWQPTKDWYKDLGGDGDPNFDSITL